MIEFLFTDQFSHCPGIGIVMIALTVVGTLIARFWPDNIKG